METVRPSVASNKYDFVTLALGVLFLAAPWAFGYARVEAAAAASIVAGLAIVACAVVALAELPHMFEEVDAALGVLAAAAPWYAGFAAQRQATLVHVALGLAVTFVSLAELWWERSRKPPAGA